MPTTRPGPGLPAEALDLRRLRTLFQPLVDLGTERVIGHEALSRGPAGTLLEQPARLFAAARAAGRTAELDWACRCSAFRDALRSTRLPGWRLFVNAEPETLGSTCPPSLLPDWLRAHRRLRVVVELTERHLLARPAELLRVVGTLRELGWEVALDDVGANDDGVALLPVVEPDVVKLDAELLGPRLTEGQRGTLRAVEAWTARTGTPIVAEGIETEAQLRRAVDLGATWGQGFRFGRPEPQPGPVAPGDWARPVRRSLAEERAGSTPCDVVHAALGALSLRTTPAGLEEALAGVCAQAGQQAVSALLLLALDPRTAPPAGLLDALDALHDRCSLVALLGARAPQLPAGSRLRTTVLDPGDRLAGEVAAVLLGPHAAVVVAGRRRRDGDLDLVRSTDPELVARAARLLLARATPVEVEEPGQALPVA